MTKQELLQKTQNDKITKEEVFEYFGVKNIDGLESVFAQKFDVANDNLSFLDGSLPYIYSFREKENFNPIEEQYMLYGIAAQGIYGVDMDEISIINGYFGPFRTLMMLEAILKDKPEVVFFEKMYNKYIARVEDMSYILVKGMRQILDFASKNLQNVDPEGLSKAFEEFKLKADEILTSAPKDN